MFITIFAQQRQAYYILMLLTSIITEIIYLIFIKKYRSNNTRNKCLILIKKFLHFTVYTQPAKISYRVSPFSNILLLIIVRSNWEVCNQQSTTPQIKSSLAQLIPMHKDEEQNFTRFLGLFILFLKFMGFIKKNIFFIYYCGQ